MAANDKTRQRTRFYDLFLANGIVQRPANRIKLLIFCISLDLVFSFSIFGFISIKPIAVTTVHIPVILAAMLCGPLGGAVTGLVFGLMSMWKASVTATAYADIVFSPWKSGNVFGSLVLSLGMRMLFGFAAGLLFSAMFRRVNKKWHAPAAAAIAVVSTMFHSFIVSSALKVFFPKADSGALVESIAPNLRHISVWVITAAVLFFSCRIASNKKLLEQYDEVIRYKRRHKTLGNRFIIFTMLIFLVVAAAIVAHSFDRLELISITDSSTPTDMAALHIAAQQLVALLGVIYIIALILLFVYEKGNIAASRLKEKQQEEIYRQKLQKTLDVMQALSRDYEVVMNVDIKTGRVTMYRCSEALEATVDEESVKLPFSKGSERFFRMIACEEDLPELLDLSSEEKILGYLKNDEIFTHVFKSNKGRFGEIKIVPISDHEFVCGYTDVDKTIREKIKQQEKLEEAMHAAEAANEAKSAFLLNMSHDIRTPMNAIIGYTDILAKYRNDEKEFERCTGNIKASGKYLMDLINNVLEMARIESGAEEINEKPCNIRPILGNTIIVFKEEAEKKGITLTYDRNIRHNYLYCDRVKIQEIYLNIISNAVKYTKSGGSIKIISSELPDEREGWCRIQIIVSDTGMGMSKEFVEHIYDDFAREKDSTTSGVAGTGLGMGIVKKIVTMMNGEIEIDSKKGVGTTVRVVIPHRIADEMLEQDNEKPIEYDSSLFKGKRVLLAEDNELNAEIAAELLGDAGLLVEHAKDGIICVSMLETAQAGYYDVILMDVQMPNMDGYQATQIIRKLSDRKKAEIPIIAMTANAFASDREQALAAGMNEHIGKPVSIDKLISTLSEFISK
ncbi:MAG: response regulator [Ruminococcus sp.]|nr:response regulator [Ruminococcus sp.]